MPAPTGETERPEENVQAMLVQERINEKAQTLQLGDYLDLEETEDEGNEGYDDEEEADEWDEWDEAYARPTPATPAVLPPARSRSSPSTAMSPWRDRMPHSAD